MVLKTFASRSEAELIKCLLETHGIKSSIIDDEAGTAQPFLQQAKGVSLEVSARDSSKALDILTKNSESAI